MRRGIRNYLDGVEGKLEADLVVSAEGVSMGHDEIQGLDREEIPFAGASWLRKKEKRVSWICFQKQT